jgi:hypothetical protein
LTELDELLKNIDKCVDPKNIIKALNEIKSKNESKNESEIERLAMQIFSILQTLKSFDEPQRSEIERHTLDAIVALSDVKYYPIYYSMMEILDADNPDMDVNKRLNAVKVLGRFLAAKKENIEEIKFELERISKEDGDSKVESRAKLLLERF